MPSKPMIVLIVTVEISDQMNRSKDVVLGVFDDVEKLNEARGTAAGQYYNKRHYFKEYAVMLNEPIL